MKKNRKSILIIVLITAIFAGAGIGYFTYRKNSEEQKGRVLIGGERNQVTAAIAECINKFKSTKAKALKEPPYISPVDFNALRQQNPDIIAWITIPDSPIDYPVVQADNNDKYLHTDSDGRENIHGAIFLDCDSNPDFSGYHNILYGHNMKNGSMFQHIIKYKQEDFFHRHRDIYIYTPERKIHLRTIAALYTDAGGEKRQTKFKSDEEFAKYVNKLTSGCRYRRLPEENITTLYSLVTCSYEFNNARTILYAYEP